MAELWEDGTWSAWDGERTVWFSNWQARRGNHPVPAAELVEQFAERTGLEGERVDLDVEGMVGRGAISPYEEDGEES